jgi:hypothetical protein
VLRVRAHPEFERVKVGRVNPTEELPWVTYYGLVAVPKVIV